MPNACRGVVACLVYILSEAWWADRRTDHYGQEKPSQLQLFACRVVLWDFLAPGRLKKGIQRNQAILPWDRPNDEHGSRWSTMRKHWCNRLKLCRDVPLRTLPRE
jgi:hypothetical protein